MTLSRIIEVFKEILKFFQIISYVLVEAKDNAMAPSIVNMPREEEISIPIFGIDKST